MRLSRTVWPFGLVSAWMISFLVAAPPGYRPSLGGLDPEGIDDDPFLVAELEAPRPRKIQSADEPLTVSLKWSSMYRSAKGRPIEIARLGEGPSRIVVMSSIHGNETQSLYLVTNLAKHLADNPEVIAGQTVLVIRTPNPDGLQAGTAFNSRGVDLNRNFPSNNWKQLPQNRGGPRVGSEVETRAIVRMLEEFRPELVIHVKDTRDTSIINAEGDIQAKTEALAKDHNWKDAKGLGQMTSGSLEHWCNTRLKCACLTMLAHREQSPDDAWEQYQPVLLSALDDLSEAPSTATTTRRRAGQSASARSPLTDDAEDTVFLKSNRTQPALEDDGPIPEAGYVELPPSPGP